MRQLVTAILILLVLWSCDSPTKKKVLIIDHGGAENERPSPEMESSPAELAWNYNEVKKKNLDSLLRNICTASQLEFMDLYPTMDSISSDQYENLVLVDLLKTKDFKVIKWGRGNWMGGPRIVSYTMSNQQCQCQVDKLYYSLEQEGRYKVTERIRCIQPI